MKDLIPKTTDEELERYYEAEATLRARIPMEGNAALKFEHDPVTKRENAYFPLSSGGYVKIGDRAVTPAQAAETDVLAAEREIQNDARGPIGDVIGGAGGPTMEDYEAAGFTEAEVVQFQAQEQARVLSQPGIEVPVQLTEEQMQFGEDVGAPMLTATPGSAGAPLDFEMPPSGALERLAVAIGKGLVEGTVVSPLQFVLDTFGVQEPQIVQDLDQALQLDEDASVLLEQLPKGIAQFFGPFAAVGKLLRLGRGFLPTMGQAAAADFLGFEGNEGRLTDVLLEFGLPPNAITEMLRTDPNDPEYIGRIKNAAEGALLGIPIEAVARVVGALRSGSAKELEGSLSEMQQGAQLSFRQCINNLTSDFVGAARATGRMDPDMMREIFQRGGQPRSLGAAGTGVDDAALVGRTEEFLEQAAPDPKIASAITAFHGSPYDFDFFDIGKMGTGQGEQRYGPGLYFSEAENVAKEYRDDLTDRRIPPLNNRMREISNEMNEISTGYRQWKSGQEDRGRALAAEYDDLMEQRSNMRGHLYEVNIRSNPEDFLDFNAPISQQSEKVKEVLMPFVEQRISQMLFPNELTTEQWMDHLRGGDILGLEAFSEVPVSRALIDAGIPGVRYLERASRAGREGVRNYVVFDDQLIDIVKKYGVAGLAVGAAVQSDMGIQDQIEDEA